MSSQVWSPGQFLGKEDLSNANSVALTAYNQLNLDAWPDKVPDEKKSLLFIE